MKIVNKVFNDDCIKVLSEFKENSIAACITDPPYNYEFIGYNKERFCGLKHNVFEFKKKLNSRIYRIFFINYYNGDYSHQKYSANYKIEHVII